MPGSAYNALLDRYRELQALDSAVSLMNWDRQVLMPPGGAEARSAQTAVLSTMHHEMLVSDETRTMLEDAEKEAEPGSDEAAALKVFRRELDIETKLPTELVARKVKVSGDAYEVWRKAKQESNFAAMLPYYQELFEINKETSRLLDPDAEHPYDPLFDQYEQGAKTKDAIAMFEAIKGPIVDLVKEIVERGQDVPDSFLYGEWDQPSLRKAAEEISSKIGFDYGRGRLDIANNAFCNGTTRGDVRMTTRPSDHIKGILSSSLHEMGHGLYEQGSAEKWDRTPLAGGVSLAVHESQSRLWENIIGRSRPFWSFFLPVLQKHMAPLANLDLDTFYRAMNKVKPDFVRVGADELTYNLHILIRFELEVALITNALDVKDLPEAWNAKYTDYLGITPPNDGLGVLQDVHWSRGYCGYFPTYSMGNLIGAQVWSVLQKDVGNTDELMAKGDFKPILGWLQEKIYTQGRRYEPQDLVKRVTGEAINPKPWLDYARSKFSEIYAL